MLSPQIESYTIVDLALEIMHELKDDVLTSQRTREQACAGWYTCTMRSS